MLNYVRRVEDMVQIPQKLYDQLQMDSAKLVLARRLFKAIDKKGLCMPAWWYEEGPEAQPSCDELMKEVLDD